jgi:hypothetical protein
MVVASLALVAVDVVAAAAAYAAPLDRAKAPQAAVTNRIGFLIVSPLATLERRSVTKTGREPADWRR